MVPRTREETLSKEEFVLNCTKLLCLLSMWWVCQERMLKWCWNEAETRACFLQRIKHFRALELVDRQSDTLHWHWLLWLIPEDISICYLNSFPSKERRTVACCRQPDSGASWGHSSWWRNKNPSTFKNCTFRLSLTLFQKLVGQIFKWSLKISLFRIRREKILVDPPVWLALSLKCSYGAWKIKAPPYHHGNLNH